MKRKLKLKKNIKKGLAITFLLLAIYSVATLGLMKASEYIQGLENEQTIVNN